MFYTNLTQELDSLRTEIFYTGNALIPHENVDNLQTDFDNHIKWVKDRIAHLQKHGDIALNQHYFSIYQKAQEEINELRDILVQFG